ncbi:AAA family ATPase, partial [Streptomyces sp. 2MCAF27]
MIDRLTLHNFKAFRDASLPLGPLTLLTGLNSSGKSSVLQA